MQEALSGILSMQPLAKKSRNLSTETIDCPAFMVSQSLSFIAQYKNQELSAVQRTKAQAEARACVRQTDKLLEKLLDVRIITTQRGTDGEGAKQLYNHVNLRISNEFCSMIHHERAFSTSGEVMFCFMASSELEPVVIVVMLHETEGRVTQLDRGQFDLLQIALEQFRVRFGMHGESYSYTSLQARNNCSWHSRHFHLKIRIPTEMYLRVFPVMQVLGNNHGCKRTFLEPYKRMWEPLQYKFELKAQVSWEHICPLILQDITK